VAPCVLGAPSKDSNLKSVLPWSGAYNHHIWIVLLLEAAGRSNNRIGRAAYADCTHFDMTARERQISVKARFASTGKVCLTAVTAGLCLTAATAG
jgi:hypothetical protein